MQLTIEGTWYNGNCQVFSGVYAGLGSVTHYNYEIQNTGSSICGGYSFKVVDLNSGSAIYFSTSSAQDVALRFDGQPPLNSQKYDCINGTCIIKTQYNTPGLYNSLSDCQAVCANGGSCGDGKQCVDPTTFCPDGKVCIDQGEFDSVEALISRIGSEVC